MFGIESSFVEENPDKVRLYQSGDAIDYTTEVKLFANDKAGYGLAQWTYPTRKQNLLTFHKKKGVSIGDLETQLEFLVQELKSNFSSLWKLLKTSNSLEEAAVAVLTKFERPANQDESVQ